MRKTFAVLAVAVAATFAAPAVAQADNHDYPSSDIAGTVTSGVVEDGEPVGFSGGGFAPRADIAITVDGPDTVTIVTAATTRRVVQAAADGTFSASITFDTYGRYTLTATGADADGGTQTVSASVTVTGEDEESGVVDETGGAATTLPRTGAQDTAAQLWAGVGLLGLGAGLVTLTVARRKVAANA